MGIKGLLPLLQSAQEDRPLSHFQGQKAGIDGYVWLHRAAYAHASELAIHKNDRPVLEMIWHKMAQHLLRYCNRLLAHDVTPYVVFDGGFLPLKEGEERTRDSSRAAAYEKGMELWKAGDAEGARKAFVGAYDVVPEMASACCRLFDGRGIDYVVAPYEADSQLSYLCEAGFVDFVITEDSDLLPFRTHSVLYKLDLSGGGEGSAAGKHVCMDDSFSDRVTDSHLEKVFAGIDDEISCKGTKMKRGNNTTVTSAEEAAEQRRKKMDTVLSRLLTACILLGCDYGDTTIDKAGPKKVSELVAKAGIDPDRVQRCARFDGLEVKSHFLKNFLKAWLCFRYQTVYCPRLKRLVSRSMIEVGGEDEVEGAGASSSSSGTEAEGRKSAVVSKKSCDGLAIRLWAEEADAEKHFSKLSQKQRSELLQQILNNPPDLFCGHRYEAETAQGVASGKLHPVTYEKISFSYGPGELDKNAAKNYAQPAAGAGGRKAALATTASRPALFARQHDGGFGGGGKKKLSKKEQLNQGKEAGQVDILSFFKPAEVANPEISRKMIVMEKDQAGTSTTSGTGAGTGKTRKTAGADATTRSSTGADAAKKRGIKKPLGAGDPGDEEGEDDGDNNVNAEQNRYVPSRYRGIQEALLADNVRTDFGVAKFAEEFEAPAEQEGGADDHEEVPAPAEVGAQEHGAAGAEEALCGSSRSKDAEGAVEAEVENKPDTDEEAMRDAQGAEKEAAAGEQTMDVDSGAVAGDAPVQSGIGIARAAAARPPSAKAATKKAAALQQKTAVPTNTIAAAASTESFFARKMKNKKQDIAAAVGVDDDATGEDKGENVAGDDFFADFAFAGSQDSAAHAKTNLKRLKPAFHVAVAAAGPGRGGAAGMERNSNKGVGAASKIMTSKMGKKNGQSAGGANTETATTNTAAPAVVVPVAGPARGSRKRPANAPSAAGSAMKEIGVQNVEEKDGPLDAGASSAAARKKQKVDTADEPLGAVGKRKEVVIPSGLSTSSLDFLNSLGWQRN